MPEKRLSQLDTSWTSVTLAHQPGEAGQLSMNDLITRYYDAVEGYLRLKLRDPHLADEVLQEFWKKLLDHRLAGADKTKGRFRDYLRTVLHRLIVDHFRTRKLQTLPAGDLLDNTGIDEDYDEIWRAAVINRVWIRLETFQSTTPNNRYATVLRLRVQDPKASIEDLASRLEHDARGRAMTPEAFRKTLQRARAKFLELLVVELRENSPNATQEDIEAEILDLGLGHVYKRYAASDKPD